MTIEEFQNVEMKVGKIISAENVDGSDKLLKLEVNFGEEDRQVISGIAKSYTPEDLLNKEAIFVTNLDPREIMGLQSEAMILAVRDEGGKPIVLIPEKEVLPGSQVS